MVDKNEAKLEGTIAYDPEFKTLASGQALLKMVVATRRKINDGRLIPTYHDITMWGDLANQMSSVLSKGDRVIVTGSIEKRSYTNKDGEKRWDHFVNAAGVRKIDGGGEAENGTSPARPKLKEVEDQLPF